MKHHVNEKVKFYAPGYGVINGIITDIIKASYFEIYADNGYTYRRFDLDLEGWGK